MSAFKGRAPSLQSGLSDHGIEQPVPARSGSSDAIKNPQGQTVAESVVNSVADPLGWWWEASYYLR